MTGPRPTATSSSSASITSPPSTVTATPWSVTLTLWNGVPVRKAIVRLRNARSRALEDASSSTATSRGSASMIVTSAPKLRQTLANSQPITPPPSTTTDDGTASSRIACSEVITRSPSMSRPGSERAYEPEASTTCRPVWAVPSTVTSRGPVSRPAPSITVIPRDLIRPPSPLYSRETTPSL